MLCLLFNHAHKKSPEQRLYICSALSTQIQNAHSRDEAEHLFRRQWDVRIDGRCGLGVKSEEDAVVSVTLTVLVAPASK